jgi:hypothetical protein
MIGNSRVCIKRRKERTKEGKKERKLPTEQTLTLSSFQSTATLLSSMSQNQTEKCISYRSSGRFSYALKW